MATIVNRGMRWTQEAAQKAAAGHYYLKVGEKSGELLITGAEKRWKDPKYVGDIYIPQLRIAGTTTYVQQLLNNLNTPSDQVSAYLQSAYTRDNYTGLKQKDFDTEVEAARVYHRQQKELKANTPTNILPAVTLGDLKNIVGGLDGAKKVAARTGAVVKPTRTRRLTRKEATTVRNNNKKTLAERLHIAQNAGKVLDVSNMTDEGTNVKLIARPTGKTNKVGPTSIAVVSSKADRFVAAMGLLGPTFEKFINEYNNITGVAPVAQPARVKTPSPRATARIPVPTSPAAAIPAAPIAPSILSGLPTTLPNLPSIFKKR
jgi:hypothetical protein